MRQRCTDPLPEGLVEPEWLELPEIEPNWLELPEIERDWLELPEIEPDWFQAVEQGEPEHLLEAPEPGTRTLTWSTKL